MFNTNVGTICRRVASVVVTSLIVGSGAAHAAVFVANWDPLFNPSFTSDTGVDLSWSGSATFDVPNGCISPSTTVNFPNGCGVAALTGFTYGLSNTVGDFGGAGGFGASLVGFAFPDSVRFDASSIVDGVTLPGPFQLNGFPILIAGDDYNVFLNFVITPFYSGPELTLTLVGCEFDCSYVSDTSGAPGPYTPVVTWTVLPESVPEPATLALIGIGLLAAGAARRRR